MVGKGKSESLHRRRKSLAAPLSPELRDKYDRRSLPVRVGDKVMLSRGDFRGMEGEVNEVDTKNRKLKVEGVETVKADGSEVPTPVHPSNVMITELERDDKRAIVVERKPERRPEGGQEGTEEASETA